MDEKITLVTGNEGKKREFAAVFGDKLETVDLDLPEIQSLDVREVAALKAREAFARLKRPVLVDDVAFHLEAWRGLPGPFVKYFEKAFPREGLIRLLGDQTDRRGRAVAALAYCDARTDFVVVGEVSGTVLTEPRGRNGFGFDFAFVPEGETRTFAEMSPEEKNTVSHRACAIAALKEEFARRGLFQETKL